MAKYAALGTAIAFGDQSDGTSTVWTTIAQVKSISGVGGGSTEEIDVTTHDSTGGYREFLAGFRDGGEVTFDIVYDPALASHAVAAGILSLYNSGNKRDFRVTMTDSGSSIVTFAAFVRSVPTDFPLDDAMVMSITLRVSGAITWP